MNAPRLTDAQISQALRVHVPERAGAGLRERVLDAVATTTQQRALPSFLGALSEADPVTRRRSLLIAAALLVALAIASAAAVGALRLLQRDPVPDLSIEPPADLPAFVLSSYERLPQLPPLALTWHDSGSEKGRVYINRSGAVRFDRFTSAETTEPSSYTILSDHRISGMAIVESQAVWVEPGHEAIGDDPRVFLRTVLNAAEGPGCEMERDPSAVGSGTAATGWRYVGAEYVAGRPTHHVACVGDLSLDIDLWLDIETRLILRTREPETDDAGQPIPGRFGTQEVTEITFGEQPAALFEAPEGVAHVTSEAYSAYLCTRDVRTEVEVGFGTRECAPPEPEETPPPESTPLPTSTPEPIARPSPSGPAGPLVWTEASVNEDWPAPVRSEPAGGASVQPMPLVHIDPTGDTGSDVDPWVDIRDLRVNADGTDLWIELASNFPPVVDPSRLWIAFGLVVDTDRDGVPDVRYGMDNQPITVEGEVSEHRAWRTDLHTGRTVAGKSYGLLGETFFHISWPGEVEQNGLGALIDFGGGDTTTGEPFGGSLEGPFYAWASVIEHGRVVATDNAPDIGWLVATPGAKPGGTYVLDDPFPLRLSMSVADGWTVVEEQRFYHAGSVTRDDGTTGIRFVMVDTLAEDACAERAGVIDARATVDDLVAFLGGLPLIDTSEDTDVTLDGYHGKHLEFARTAGEIDCGWGGLDGWPASSPTASDEDNRVWILDVDGAPLVIDAFSDPEASENVRAELRQIVESIQIKP